jgi:hypothetical protein
MSGNRGTFGFSRNGAPRALTSLPEFGTFPVERHQIGSISSTVELHLNRQGYMS